MLTLKTKYYSYEDLLTEIINEFEVHDNIIKSRTDPENKVDFNIFIDSFSHLLKLVKLLNENHVLDESDKSLGIYESSFINYIDLDISNPQKSYHILLPNLELILSMVGMKNLYHVYDFKISDNIIKPTEYTIDTEIHKLIESGESLFFRK